MNTNPAPRQPADRSAQVVGTAAGVPFVAVPPDSAPTDQTPVVVAWHLMDAPRTETAFAAALPLAGLDAWRIYLGLPKFSSRLPDGGLDEIMRQGYEDAVMNLQGPVSEQAAAEFPAAYAELQERLGLRTGPVGVLGGSLGAAVALTLLAERPIAIDAAVLVSPMVQLHPAVEALGEFFGVTYPWSTESLAVAQRMDFVARAEQVGRDEPAIQLVVGADDHPTGFQEPAARLRDALAASYADPDRVELITVASMPHALAEEPGLEPAPQVPHAGEVDRHAARWFQTHLASTRSR